MLLEENTLINSSLKSLLVLFKMRLLRQFQACLFIYFFDENTSCTQKHVTSENQVTKQKQANTKQQRQQFFECA